MVCVELEGPFEPVIHTEVISLSKKTCQFFIEVEDVLFITKSGVNSDSDFIDFLNPLIKDSPAEILIGISGNLEHPEPSVGWSGDFIIEHVDPLIVNDMRLLNERDRRLVFEAIKDKIKKYEESWVAAILERRL